MQTSIRELRDAYYGIVALDLELGISSESVLDEIYRLWNKGIISNKECEDFFTFAMNIDKSAEAERKYQRFLATKEDKPVTRNVAAKSHAKKHKKQQKVSKESRLQNTYVTNGELLQEERCNALIPKILDGFV